MAMDIFDCALKMEEQARDYYEKLAQTTSVTELKNLFKLLAESEQEHHDALEKLKANITPDTQLKGVEEAACVFRPLLTKRDLMEELKEDPDAYRHVIKGEEDGVRLYEELALQEQDAAVRDVILKIADEERKHLSIVENIYSFVESPKNYLAWGEFGNLNEY
jgi:rubrerythrin